MQGTKSLRGTTLIPVKTGTQTLNARTRPTLITYYYWQIFTLDAPVGNSLII